MCIDQRPKQAVGRSPGQTQPVQCLITQKTRGLPVHDRASTSHRKQGWPPRPASTWRSRQLNAMLVRAPAKTLVLTRPRPASKLYEKCFGSHCRTQGQHKLTDNVKWRVQVAVPWCSKYLARTMPLHSCGMPLSVREASCWAVRARRAHALPVPSPRHLPEHLPTGESGCETEAPGRKQAAPAVPTRSQPPCLPKSQRGPRPNACTCAHSRRGCVCPSAPCTGPALSPAGSPARPAACPSAERLCACLLLLPALSYNMCSLLRNA